MPTLWKAQPTPWAAAAVVVVGQLAAPDVKKSPASYWWNELAGAATAACCVGSSHEQTDEQTWAACGENLSRTQGDGARTGDLGEYLKGNLAEHPPVAAVEVVAVVAVNCSLERGEGEYSDREGARWAAIEIEQVESCPLMPTKPVGHVCEGTGQVLGENGSAQRGHTCCRALFLG